MARKRWVAVALVGIWAVVLVGAAVWSTQIDSPTVREQSGLVEGRLALDDAVDEVVAAAGAAIDVEVSDYRIERECRLTVVWRGTSVEREVMLTVPAGAEASVLDRLAVRLPDHWRASHFRPGQRLSADAGDFVAVVGEVTAPGKVRVTAATGCRPGSDPGLSTG